MSLAIRHDHVPIYRVVRRGWPEPLDTTFSQQANVDNRWNTADFPALYCCCSPSVARAIVKDVFHLAGVDLEDLQEDARPQLVEIHWTGEVVDMVSDSAIISAGFESEYPGGSERSQTRQAAVEWHQQGAEGILCRSASVGRLGFARWEGDHQPWSELAIFAQNAVVPPAVLKRRSDLAWLAFSSPGE
jgi:RES domain-containing protein